ncbi:hypothetical protein CPB84DRAFT_1652237, partial [Gymnopilus junonius]
YIAGFAQARSPHAGLLIPLDSKSGFLVHICIDRNTSPLWQYQSRKQNISGDMFMTSLLRIHNTMIVPSPKNNCKKLQAPSNDQFSECLPWVLSVVQKLHDIGLLNLIDTDGLAKEFEEF